MTSNIVVIGAGQAACSFAAKMRELDSTCRITLIGEEASLPYQRPPLSKKYMTGEMELERLLLRPADWYANSGIYSLLSAPAVRIDREARAVVLANGRSVPYDRLLMATGSEPRRLPAAIGGDLAGVYVLRNLADADALTPELRPGRRVLVVGGGYIGLEAAAVAASLGLHVRVAEMAPRILQRVAAPQTSDYFRAVHRSHGVEIMEGKALSRLVGEDGRVVAAEFADGDRFEVDFVLVGIGVTPNSSWATYRVVQLGEQGVVAGFGSGAGVLNVGTNFYWDGSAHRYLATDFATQYQQNAGDHLFRTAASGTAGNAITFATRVTFTNAGEVWIGYTADQGAYLLQVNSQIFATNATIATSDGRFKTDVQPVREGLAAVNALQPVQFKWKKHPVHNFIDGTDVGFIAQDVRAALTGRDYTGAVVTQNGSGESEFLGMADSKLIPLLVAAVQELRAEVNALKAH